jgi:hypothetical protein
MADVLERGDVVFLYRPRVDVQEVRGVDDVQRLHAVLRPEGGAFRRIVFGRRTLPPPGWAGRRHSWAYVDEVEARPDALDLVTEPERYSTKTRGERTQGEDRPLGEGAYVLVRHGDHTHLRYALVLPEEPGPAQEALHLASRGDWVVSVKDPASPDRGQPSAPGRPELPRELLEGFGGRRFAPVDPPALLDHPFMELLLIPATEDDDPGVEPGRPPAGDEVLEELDVAPGQAPARPLEEGDWA